MGLAKEVQFADKKIKVRTISADAMMGLEAEGKDRHIGELIRASLSPEDAAHIKNVDFQGPQTQAYIDALFEAWKEVNPSFFQKKPSIENKETSSIGAQENSDGHQPK